MSDNLGEQAKGIGVAFILIALVLAVLQGFTSSGALTDSANTTVTNVVTAIGTYGTWATVIVLLSIGVYFFKKMNKF